MKGVSAALLKASSKRRRTKAQILAEKAEAAKAQLKDIARAPVDVVLMDMSRLDDVRRGAAELLERYPQIHVLVNNAGIHSTGRELTEEGHEMVFAVNHLSSFLLTRLLLDRMKEGAVLINTSRGFVVDDVALAALLERRPRARAYLDVHDPEPFDAAYPLLARPNAVLYPHLASRTDRALRAMSWVVRDVVAVLEGQEPRYPAPATE